MKNLKLNMGLSLVVVCAIGIACSTKRPERDPAAESLAPATFIDAQTIKLLQGELESLSLGDCSAVLSRKYTGALKLTPQQFSPAIFSDIPTALEFTDAAFALRIRLRSKLREWHSQSQSSGAGAQQFATCLNHVRDAIRATRYLDEYVSQVILSRNAWKANDQVLSFQEPMNPELRGFFLKVNPAYAAHTGAFAQASTEHCSSNVDVTHRAWLNEKTSALGEFCSGDVISSRGRAHTSAAITRVVDTAGQYSHISMVYVNGKHEVSTIESLIENGVHIEPLFHHLVDAKNDGPRNFRETLYRAPAEAEYVHSSAHAIFSHISELVAAGKSVDYDFTMNQAESDHMFCSEVVSWGYGHAAVAPRTAEWQSRKIPLFLSRIAPHSNPVTRAMQVKQSEVFAPSDIDVDYRFEIVAEWRDLKSIRDSMEKDAILAKVFQWLKKENWEFDYGVKASFAWIMSESGLNYTPIPKLLLGAGISPTINGDTAAAFIIISQVGEAIQKKLRPVAAEIEKANGGYPATFEQLTAAVEKIGREDLSGDQEFTSLLHPHKKGWFEK